MSEWLWIVKVSVQLHPAWYSQASQEQILAVQGSQAVMGIQGIRAAQGIQAEVEMLEKGSQPGWDRQHMPELPAAPEK